MGYEPPIPPSPAQKASHLGHSIGQGTPLDGQQLLDLMLDNPSTDCIALVLSPALQLHTL